MFGRSDNRHPRLAVEAVTPHTHRVMNYHGDYLPMSPGERECAEGDGCRMVRLEWLVGKAVDLMRDQHARVVDFQSKALDTPLDRCLRAGEKGCAVEDFLTKYDEARAALGEGKAVPSGEEGRT